MSSDPNDIPRHIRIALTTAQRAFDNRDLRVFGTFNEDLQPVVDAASAWITALGRDLTESRAETKAARDELAALRLERKAHAVLLDCARRDRDEARANHAAASVILAGWREKAKAAEVERDALQAALTDSQRSFAIALDHVQSQRDAYHTFAVSIAQHLAAPGAEDLAAKLTPADLPTLADCVRGEYESGRAAGDRARFGRCVTDITRAMGGDERRPMDWGDLVESVRAMVKERDEARGDMADVQARYARAWEALCRIGEALEAAGYPQILPERALRVGEGVARLVEERDALRAQLAEAKTLGASLHKASAAGYDRCTGDVVAWLRTDGPALAFASCIGGDEYTCAADAITKGAYVGAKERE